MANEVYILPASNSRQRIVTIFAGKTNEKLVPVQEETDILTIDGFVGKTRIFEKEQRRTVFLCE